jgi:hypothetical protein
MRAAAVWRYAGDAVVKNGFDVAVDSSKDGGRRSPRGRLRKRPPVASANEVALNPAARVLSRFTIRTSRTRHALGDVIARTPEIDDVPARSQVTGAFHDRRREAITSEPVRECGTRDAGS